MPPRRGARKSAATATASASQPTIASDVGPKIAEAIGRWTSGGDITAQELLSSHLEQAASSSTTLGTIPLSHLLIALLSSEIDPATLAELFVKSTDGLDDLHIEVFGENLVDAVEVMEQEKEDALEEKKANEDSDMAESDEKPKISSGLPVIKLLLESDKLPTHIANLLLNTERLIDLGLHPYPRTPRALQSAFVKKNTTLFFKQRKYNLLRECSEGFSGLIVLLTGLDALPQTAAEIAAESDEERSERAKRVWSKIMGLIGYFNLSPPRVLDIILEIASCHVAVHWRFFLELLKCSPWGAAAIASEGKGKGKAVHSWPSGELEGIQEVMSQGGDRVLAQVLGFKFGYYKKPEGGDTPIGLTYMAALLIRNGFVSLADLLPFLSPDDSQMEDIRKKWLSSVSSRSGPSNALSNSVLLDDETSAGSSTNDAEAGGPPPKPPQEQRIQLLQALLAIGDLPSSIYFLSRFPWVTQSHTAIADLILRNIAQSLQSFYRSYAGFKIGVGEDDLDLDVPAPTVPSEEKEIVPTLAAPPPPETNKKRFEFFYPDWADEIEVWTSIDDIHSKGLRWLTLVRGLGGRHPSIMVQLCRIGAVYFASLRKEKELSLGAGHARTKEQLALVEPTAQQMRPWLDLIRISLLPSLSGSGATAAFDIELWSLLKYFPYTVRYSLYGEWRDSTCSFKGRNPCPVAAQAAAECTKEVQKALRRVTSSSTSGSASAATQAERYSARYLAKLSHGNPLFLWITAVTQVKAYPNIGQAIVDAGRYMTQLSFDVATFVMLDTLSDDRAQRLNENGTGVAMWLERLSKFVGDFNRRYANMDLDPVLQYIINRLMRGHSGDLIILEKLMSTMSGIEPVPNDGVSETQLRAYAGGREMVREAFNATRISIAPPPEPGSTDKPKEAPVDKLKNVKKSLPRLVNALRDTKLAIPIWIALAQTRQGVVDKLSNTPLKAMNLVQDTCHTAFMQFGDFLVEQLSSEEHISTTPELAELVNDFGLEYGMAFQILRPRLNAELDKMRADERAAVQRRLLAEKKAMNERLNSPTNQGNTPLPASPPKSATPLPETDDVTMDEVKVEQANGDKPSDGSSVPAPRSAGKVKAWWPSALTGTMQQARKILPREANEVMSAPFFVIFWHLTMSDIAFSAESYDISIKSIRRNISIVSGWKIMAKDKVALAEQQNELARLKARVAVLEKEKEGHQSLVNGPNRRRLRLESSKWFGKSIVDKSLQRVLSFQLHQYCFYPRAILTPCDAVFVAKFIRTAHDLGTVGFSTLFAYNNFFSDNLAACIFSCTDSEARNLGRCLAAILTDLDVWHQDESKYRREALGIPDNVPEGEEPKPLPGMLFRPKLGDEMRPMNWSQFKNFYAKCHKVLARALVSCWSEAEFMHNKNAIIIALQVIKFFPAMDYNGKAVEEAVKKLHDGEVGEITNDLKMMCLSFLTGLRKRQELRPYVTATVFHNAPARPTPANALPTGPKTADSPAVNGSATPLASTNGASTPVPAAPATADPKALRQKLEEGRAKAGTGAGALKDEAKVAAESAARGSKAGTPAASRPTSPTTRADNKATPPPAGPRVTRASAAPTGPSANARSQDGRSTPVPGGPANPRGLPERPTPGAPASTSTSSMGPPAELSVDEARAAARAKKFGTIIRPAPPPSSSSPATSNSPQPSTALAEPATAKSPTPAAPSRRTSPAPRTHRSGSLESRASVGSRRSRRERDDRDRDREREKDRDRGRDRDRRGRDDRDQDHGRDKDKDKIDVRTKSLDPLVAGADDDKDRRRQEDLLQSRHDRLASDSADDRRESRRGSRDSGHRRESEKEREERKAREKEKDKDKDERRGHRDDRDTKRKREEEPRRADEPATVGGRRDDRRDRERRHERPGPDDRDRDPRGDRDRGGERDRDRDRNRDRDRGDRRERDRDEREHDRRRRDREPHHPQGPGRDARRSPERRPIDRVPSTGDRTPQRDNASRELLPSRPDSSAPSTSQNAGQGDRIVEAPRQAQSSVAPSSGGGGVNRLAHALPPRPGSNNPPATVTATTPASAPNGGGGGERGNANQPAGGPSLAMRMGPAPTPSRSPPRVRSPERPREDRGTPGGDRNSGSAEPRKRALEDTGGPVREESPGASKRVKIDRERARGRRDGGGGRMLQAAMGGARDK